MTREKYKMSEVNKRDNWLSEIAKDKGLWVEDISKWPSIIAYTYESLRHLCEEGKAYGVQMRLKDNFETILKFETLIAFAWAEHNTDDTFIEQTISLITTPNLSMDAWVELAKILIQDLDDRSMRLPKEIPLWDLCEQYENMAIVTWRNQKIGHGAMELDEDEEFRDEIYERIEDLHEVLNELHQYLNYQKLYAEGVCLEGPKLARGLSLSGEISCCLTESNIAYSVDPYILIRKHEKRGKGIYFFDNQKTRKRSTFLAYADGSRNDSPNLHFEQLRRKLGQSRIDLSAKPDDINLDEAENREIDTVQMSHSFVRPDYLVNWLKSCVSAHNKGVFLLQMERGMGKSVFTDKLDRMYKDPLVIEDDIDVRTYHFSRSQAAAFEDIRQRIEWQWANEYQGKSSWQREPRISDFELEGKTPAEAFCEFLGAVAQYTKRNRRHRKRIMMVMDGLDEIVQETVWDLLPTSEMLPEGVYLLLTSRDAQEKGIPSQLRGLKERLSVYEHLNVTRVYEGNKKFLRTYIKNAGLRKIPENEIQLLLEKADYIVLYLGMLCKLTECGTAVTDLPDVGKVVETYISAVNECYGDKESIRIREILTLISTLGVMEPLTLCDIGGLTTEGFVTLGLIGMIRDLSPMLRTIRSEEGNRYTIANSDLAEELRKQLPETEEVLSELVELGIDQADQGYPIEVEAANIVIGHIAELIDIIGGNHYSKDELSELVENIKSLSNDAFNAIGTVAEVNRYIDYKKQSLLLCRLMYGDADIKTYLELQELADAIKELKRDYNESIRLQERVVEGLKKTVGEKDYRTLNACAKLAHAYYRKEVSSGKNDFNVAYNLAKKAYKGLKDQFEENDKNVIDAANILAGILSAMGKHDEALAIQEKTYEVLKETHEEFDLDLYAAKQNIAICLLEANKIEEAAKAQRELIDEGKSLLNNNHPLSIAALESLSDIYLFLSKYEEALSLKEKVFTLSKQTLGYNHPNTLTRMNYLASTYRLLGNLDKAESIQREALELSKHILGNDSTVTIEILSQLAITCVDKEKYDEAIKLYQEIIKKKGELYGKGHREIAVTMNSIASLYRKIGQYELALSMTKDALDLFKETRGIDHFDTICALETLSELYEEMGNHEEAISTGIEALNASERVFGNRYEITIAIMIHLSNCFISLQMYERAINLMEKATGLAEALFGPTHSCTQMCKDSILQMKQKIQQE